MEVIVTPAAKKQIKRLPKIIQITVINKLKSLNFQTTNNSLKLSGYKDSYRVRIGDYRIVYRVLGKIIYVILVAHRKEIYLLLKRIFG